MSGVLHFVCSREKAEVRARECGEEAGDDRVGAAFAAAEAGDDRRAGDGAFHILPLAAALSRSGRGRIAGSQTGARARCGTGLRPEEQTVIVREALQLPDLSPRELACHVTDHAGFTVSEATVYRVLKRHGLNRTITLVGLSGGKGVSREDD